MVLWELTLATAYVLGLKRTYRLALRAQRRLLGTKYPRIRDFTERRTKAVFTMALNVHKEIQRRDITVGRNLGNWLLRMLDRARPQANIRGNYGPGSQSGPGRPDPPRFESSRNVKNSEPKQSQADRPKDSVNTSISSYLANVRRPVGSTLKSRITSELRARTRPVMRPLPTTFGLWWQAVRRQSGSVYPGPNASFSSSRLFASEVPSVHVLRIGYRQRQQSVFRDDILQWMGTPRSY